MVPPKSRGSCWPGLYVRAWPSDVDTSTSRWSRSTSQNSRDPFCRQVSFLSRISVAVLDWGQDLHDKIWRADEPAVDGVPPCVGQKGNVRTPAFVLGEGTIGHLFLHHTIAHGAFQQPANCPLGFLVTVLGKRHVHQFAMMELIPPARGIRDLFVVGER